MTWKIWLLAILVGLTTFGLAWLGMSEQLQGIVLGAGFFLALLTTLLPSSRAHHGGPIAGVVVWLAALAAVVIYLRLDFPPPRWSVVSEPLPQLDVNQPCSVDGVSLGMPRDQVEKLMGPGRRERVHPVDGFSKTLYPAPLVVYYNPSQQVVRVSGSQLEQSGRKKLAVGDPRLRLWHLFGPRPGLELVTTPSASYHFEFRDGRVASLAMVGPGLPGEIAAPPPDVTVRVDGVSLGMLPEQVARQLGPGIPLQPLVQINRLPLGEAGIYLYRHEGRVTVVHFTARASLEVGTGRQEVLTVRDTVDSPWRAETRWSEDVVDTVLGRQVSVDARTLRHGDSWEDVLTWKPWAGPGLVPATANAVTLNFPGQILRFNRAGPGQPLDWVMLSGPYELSCYPVMRGALNSIIPWN